MRDLLIYGALFLAWLLFNWVSSRTKGARRARRAAEHARHAPTYAAPAPAPAPLDTGALCTDRQLMPTTSLAMSASRVCAADTTPCRALLASSNAMMVRISAGSVSSLTAATASPTLSSV